VLRPAYPIRTTRLILRPFTKSDLDDLYGYHSLPAVTRFLYWEVHDRAQARAALDRKIHQVALTGEGQALVLAIELPEPGCVIGELSLKWLSAEHQQGEIGFVIHPACQGRGFAAEAAREGLRLGFEALGLRRIVGRCDTRNHTSATLMERLGMRREAHFVENEKFKGEWSDEYVYAMLAAEWSSRARAR
jgi:RimJ/RimL family protein N-acetyltransferase